MRAADMEDAIRWISSFAGIGIIGFLCTPLLLGKMIHAAAQGRGGCCGLLAIPPVFVSGLLGTGCDVLFYTYSPQLGFAMEYVTQPRPLDPYTSLAL